LAHAKTKTTIVAALSQTNRPPGLSPDGSLESHAAAGGNGCLLSAESIINLVGQGLTMSMPIPAIDMVIDRSNPDALGRARRNMRIHCFTRRPPARKRRTGTSRGADIVLSV
jgi:hypothetical protein